MALAAISHGKHVYSEKPLALSAADAKEMVDAARAKGRRVGGFQLYEKPNKSVSTRDYRKRRDW